MHCFACGRGIETLAGDRIGLRDSCSCGADLHVCRNCARHDPSAHNECREPQAEPVRDRERANRCDWFAPGVATAAVSADSGRDAARSRLEALFKKRP
ncbi:hypothetical protein MYXO_03003 [Myxococcaceae bacterium]|jgi:hypothetical protein|nr:hypothetical protein MYXO_03003 [Myxococcaceae bacterium]